MMWTSAWGLWVLLAMISFTVLLVVLSAVWRPSHWHPPHDQYMHLPRYRYWESYASRYPTPSEPGHSGHGPRDYVRSDARIKEDVDERLLMSAEVDARELEVQVDAGVVTLSGSVADRKQRRIAEAIADDVIGVRDVRNAVRVAPPRSDQAGG